MKLQGAGWLIGAAVIITAFSSVVACDDGGDSSGIPLSDGGDVTLPDGGGVDATTQPDANDTPTDSGADTGADVSVPAQCNDGKVDLGETCDPLGTCPTECPADGCKLRTLENGGTCTATCTVVAVQTQCQNGDGCCPSNCSVSNDNDCKAECGNGVKEPGEKCDGDCPTSCPPIGCMVRKLVGADCQAECVDALTPVITCSGVSDQCCPANCSSGNDVDCQAGACGNNLLEPPGESCDIGIPAGQEGACPTSCAPIGCNLRKLENPGTCQAVCTDNGTITQCVNGDGCCAPGCNNTNDSDCEPKCGNGVTEPPTETCDANCPESCTQQGCNLVKLENPGTCQAKCVATGDQQTQCISDDGCCPAGCTSDKDNDCAPPTCGNGKLDPGETCDFNDKEHPCTCPASDACFGTTGAAGTCNLVCNQPITKCVAKTNDACCPLADKDGSECRARTDADCKGASWKMVSFKEETLVPFKDAECRTFVISNVEPGGSYDVTTCTTKEKVAIGDVTISSVNGSTIVKPPAIPRKIPYGANKDCIEKYALPLRAGLSCDNKDGKRTMACVAETTGGFIANNESDLAVVVCGVSGDAAAPLNVFYNATKVPTIEVVK